MDQKAALRALTPRLNRYIPKENHIKIWKNPKQAAFLLLDQLEALYGGAAGGGKTEALLMAALQYVDVPGYAAVLLRRTFEQLSKADSLIPRSKQWLKHTDATWNEQKKRWTFPNGSTLEFGHIQRESDKYNFHSAAYQFIGFDELTQFTMTQYTYLFSRLRRHEKYPVPTRVRSASNPGGEGHEWVKLRFLVEGKQEGRIFIPATLEDNFALDKENYIKSLMNLDPVTRRQLMNGDWTARSEGSMFRREWFPILDSPPRGMTKLGRYWDLAGSAPRSGSDPDWTAGVGGGALDGVLYITDIARFRRTPQQAELAIRAIAEKDSVSVPIWMEEEPGASGKIHIDHYRRNVLPGFTFRSHRVTGPQPVRVGPLSAAAEAGNVRIVAGPWTSAFLDELESYTGDGRGHDDQVIAAAGLHHMLLYKRGPSWGDLYGKEAVRQADWTEGVQV